ncbi:MAG: efflux RND transporter periplasmic adaptor subunit [Bacteroidota bacterium]
MKKFVKILLVMVLIALVGWVAYYLYKQTNKDPVVYETEQPEKTDIVKKTVATGSIVPRKEIQIKPQESGIITELYVKAGDRVEEGDLMAKIQIVPEMVQVNEAENRVEKARLAFENARIEFERSKELYENKVIPESEYLNDKLSYQSAEEDYESARNHLELIKEGVVKKAGAQTNTLIRATTDGMVLDIPVEIGNSVIKSNNFNDGTTVALVADMGEMIFKGKVDETEVGKISEGMELLLTIGALDQDDFKATLEFIAPKGEEENGAIQFDIKAAVKLKEGSFIRSGYSATADIVLDRRDSVMALKEKLVHFNDDSTYVEVMTAPQEFEKRLVETGLSDGINVEIVDGLSEDDKIKVPES